MRALQYLNRYLKKYLLLLLLGLLFTVLSRVFAVLAPSLVGDSITEIEQFIQSGTTDIGAIRKILLTNIALIIGAALVSGGFTFVMRQTIINVSRHIEFDLKNTIYDHYQKLSLRFYKQNRTGDLMSRISEDVSRVRMYVGPALMYSINTLTLFVIVISYMFSVAPKLTLYTLLPLPVLSFMIYRLSKAIHERSTLVQQMLSQLSTFAQESFSGINVIKSYAIEPNRIAEMNRISEESRNKNMSLVQVQAWFFPLMILLIGISNVLVVFIGGSQYISGQIELGVLAEFIIYVNMLTWPVTTVGWVTSIVQQAEASQKRINEFLGQEPDIQDSVEANKKLESVDIAFRNVHFTYDDTGIHALHGVSFALEEGKTLAVMGPTGSGKTTLLQLLSKTYLPNSGEITLGKNPLQAYAQSDIRNVMGVVPQQVFLFSDTIANNIRFGKQDATQEEIENAAKQAAVHENIIEFNTKYDTVLGERGITLSGGQKQRVSIARALIKQPKLLLLDDCLSAVDTETEEAILSSLKTNNKNTTTLIVCHRVSSAKNADYILILKDGKVAQFGTHASLTKAEGYYKDLYAQQRLEEESL
ncbi:MAG: ABC transporter ATP-binding protein [Bacteroidetes bacterium]|nr:ABC transporter ATP-binding protein [Bacteroidota bacterium]MDA0888977.1 ABC transporter ATP-binding protein [Bacteroidota bacterium]MDA1084770.1 ABC transporter ATP-binding protein [Bacteroidota bacterium]